jgi:hypothetical protein
MLKNSKNLAHKITTIKKIKELVLSLLLGDFLLNLNTLCTFSLGFLLIFVLLFRKT